MKGRTPGGRPELLGRLTLRFGPLILLALFLLPARDAALRGDDEWSFDFRGLTELSHMSLLHEIWVNTWAPLSHGRPTFLGALTSYPVIWVFDHHPVEYHLYIVALTVLCGALLWSLVVRLTESERLAALVVVLLAATIQFRFYHDAMLGYYGATQVAICLFLGSLLTMLRVIRGGRSAWAWVLLTALLFALACSQEEWMYPLMATHVLLALVETRGRRLVPAVLPVVVVGLAFFVVGGVGAPSQTAAGYTIAFNVPHYVEAVVKSWVPPLPTSNRLFSQGPVAYFYGNGNPYPLGGSLTPAEWLAAAWRGLVVCAAVAAFCLWPVQRRPSAPSVPKAALRMVAVGAPMWLLPPLLVVIAAKYQVEGSLTRGYLESLMQVIGVVLVAGALLIWLLAVLRRRETRFALVFGAVAAVALGFAAAVDGFNNLRVVALEQPVRNTRDLLEHAVGAGVLETVPQRSTLLFSGIDMDWPTGDWSIVPGAAEAILYADSGRIYDVRPDADQQAIDCPAGPYFPPPFCADPRPSSVWVRARATLKGGVVIVARIPRPTKTTFLGARAQTIVVYVEQLGTTDPAPPPLAGSEPGGQPWSSSGLHYRRLRSGGDWAIYTASVPQASAPIAASLTDPLSTVNFESPPPPPDQLAREFGTKELLP